MSETVIGPIVSHTLPYVYPIAYTSTLSPILSPVIASPYGCEKNYTFPLSAVILKGAGRRVEYVGIGADLCPSTHSASQLLPAPIICVWLNENSGSQAIFTRPPGRARASGWSGSGRRSVIGRARGGFGRRRGLLSATHKFLYQTF